jgi:hypothetical protein
MPICCSNSRQFTIDLILSLSVCLSIYLSIYLSIHPSTRPSIHLSICSCSCSSRLEQRGSMNRFDSLQLLNFRQSVGLLWREISPLQGSYLHRTVQTQNKRKHSCLKLGLEPTIPVFERAKTFHVLRLHGHCDRPYTYTQQVIHKYYDNSLLRRHRCL